jgi:putative glycosyltransferase (TIGR04372 family)
MECKKIIFQISKPLNPIDLWNYEVTKKNSLLRRCEIILHVLVNFFKKKNKSDLKFIYIYLFQFFKHLGLNIISIAYVPAAIILYFLNYRFIHISYWQIGTLSFQVDILVKKYLLDNLGDKNETTNLKKIIFLCPANYCSNKGLLNLYKKKITVIDGILKTLFFLPFLQLPKITWNPFFIEHNIKNSESYKIYSKYDNIIGKNIFAYSLVEKDYFISKLKNLKINLDSKKIICLHLRDESFYKEQSFNSSRNANFQDYESTIKYLIKNNYCVVRFVNKISDFKEENYYEIDTSLIENQEIQIFLISIAYFFIGCSSGPLYVANLFKTPTLCTNFFPYSQLVGYNKFDLTVPKKIYSIKENRYLNLKEIFSNEIYLLASSRILDRHFLEVHNNVSDVLINATKEMINNLEKNIIVQTANQKKVYSFLPKEAGCYYGQGNLSNYFIEKNIDLIT